MSKPFRILFLTICLLSSANQAQSRPVKRVQKIKDKISFITHPLMLKAVAKGDVVTFHWTEPHWDFTYYLEIYRTGARTPFTTIPVKGGRRAVKFSKDLDNLYWRIKTVSKYGTKNPNKKIYRVPMARPPRRKAGQKRS